MKNLLQITIIIFLIQATLITANYKDEIKDFTIIKVIDGDTFVINIENVPDVFSKEIAVRIRGIDTPELNDSREEIRKISIQAKEELEKLLTSGEKVILYNLGRDKYFRLLASVRVGNVDIAEYLIKKGLAKSYNGGAKLKPIE
ncbi:thermonuclease family protein [Brachyspira aalborgi]|uniref:Thermonuclease family protein n=1 Tax=Brachyspira aalborgi TaxID=29522 RepID=A0A5C8EFH5_9SPIR|nr:thermonuclease family protein [Brachyspira aalborgi]TXJ36228.1 thermonuclease family protein [Brachyspira aalborgi]